MNVYDQLQHALHNVDTSQGWAARHVRALDSRVLHTRHLLAILEALARYADAHREEYGTPIGKDGFLGDRAWLPALRGARLMLNGELGALDGGTLDRAIIAMARAAEFSDEELEAL